MSTPSVSRADRRRILVWDAPVRVFHWLMVLSFAGAWFTAESERWRLVHVTLGYTMAALVAFRIVWGLIGTRHARFASFVRGPAAVARYVRSVWSGPHEPHIGHNPAGAVAIVALLAMTVGVAASGWTVYNELGGAALEGVHEALANAMLAIVVVHVSGVLLGSWLQRENLVAAMLTGRKPGAPADGIRRARGGLAVVLLASVLGFWWLQWHDTPPVGTSSAATHVHGDKD
jgi:cytochrome b